jgi:hypothetical protein
MAGGGHELGDRMMRRGLHLAGLAVLLYFVLPSGFFVVLPVRTVLLLALFAVLVLEMVRLGTGLELPAIRPYERHRVASYAWYAVALVVAVLLFPESVATAVVLGTALVDPLIGELRRGSGTWRRSYPWLPLALYALLAGTALTVVGGWSAARAGAGAAVAALVAIGSERPKLLSLDDDLAMTLVPAAALYAIGLLGPGAPLSLP